MLRHKFHRRTLASLRRNWIGERDGFVETCPDKLTEIRDELKKQAKKLGLGLVGITSPKKSARFELYKEWLQKNYHGELDYMEREDRVSRRENPSLILPGVRSVIMVGMMYWPGVTGFPPSHRYKPPRRNEKTIQTKTTDRGIVSSYAWGVDYHTELSRRLRTLGRHLNQVAGGVGRFYVDTGAILERDFAERAGLGFIGKNSLLINPNVGSGFFIGELFSTVPLQLDDTTTATATATTATTTTATNTTTNKETQGKANQIPPVQQKRGKPGCGRCTKCKDSCPTGAIVKDHVVDARRCISYLTIELKSDIPLDLRRGMGNRIYGCDICQIVCPWNKFQWNEKSPITDEQGYSPLFGKVGETVTTPKLVELLQADEEAFKERFHGTAVKRIGRERMARNAAVALGNVGGVSDLAALETAARDDISDLVRRHARWAADEIRARMSMSPPVENNSKG